VAGCQDQQAAVGRNEEPHPLMHHCRARLVRRAELINRKRDVGRAPMPSVGRVANERLAGRDMLADRVAQVFDEEPAVPVDDHRRVVIGPAEAVGPLGLAAVGPHHLERLDANRRPQPTVVRVGIDDGAAHVADRLMNTARLGHQRR
jgi:hypothetical protein